MKRENHFTSYSHFETADMYDRGRIDRALPLRKAAAKMLLPRLKGSVLILGWSRELQFMPPAAERIVVVDFSPNVLRSVPKRDNIMRICAETGALPFDIGTFDVVLIPDLIHHLAEDFNEETDIVMRRIFRDIANVMERKGKILVFEPLVNPILETVNRALFKSGKAVLNSRNIGAPCYLSLPSLKEIIFDSGMVLASAERVHVPGAYPLHPKYPDYTVPYNLLPIKFYLVEVRKKI